MTAHTIVDVDVTETQVVLRLADGRQLSTPVSQFPRLVAAKPKERASWVLTDDASGVNWPAVWSLAPGGALTVWEIEQDALYEDALARFAAAHEDELTIPRQVRELVSLWRLEADIYHGGFLQYFCTWGEGAYRGVLPILSEIGALATRTLLEAMHLVIAPDHEPVITVDDLPARLTGPDLARLADLDQRFWQDPDRLAERVVRHYGTAPAPDRGM